MKFLRHAHTGPVFSKRVYVRVYVCVYVCTCLYVTTFPLLSEEIVESIYFPQTSQIQFLEEGSTGQTVGTGP